MTPPDLFYAQGVLAIDPGPQKSGVVALENGRVVFAQEMNNGELLAELGVSMQADALAVEMVACYGMPVGKEVFETCLIIGRIQELAGWRGLDEPRLVYRKDVKMHLCHSMRAKDTNIRQSLIDKYGVVGTKKNQGPLFGISGHLWAALAVADYALTAEKPGCLITIREA